MLRYSFSQLRISPNILNNMWRILRNRNRRNNLEQAINSGSRDPKRVLENLEQQEESDALKWTLVFVIILLVAYILWA